MSALAYETLKRPITLLADDTAVSDNWQTYSAAGGGTVSALTQLAEVKSSGPLFDAVTQAVHAGAVVTWSVYRSAQAFMAALPRDFPTPEVSVEPDGEVGFDWLDSPRRSLSVSLGEGEIGFSALIGHESIFGRVPFVDSGPLPNSVALVLSKLL